MEKQEFERLYRETYKMVYWTCISLLKNEEDAEDTVQETFITAFEAYDTLNDKSRAPAWIKRIAANKCINKLTRTRTVAVEDEFLGNVETVPDDFLPQSITEDREKRSIMMNIISEVLSEELQRTLILYYFDELSAREISELLGVPEGTVRSRLDYAKKKIKKGVEEYEKKNNDKLYAAMLPFLTELFNKEAEDIAFKAMSAELTGLLASRSAAVAKSAAATVIKKGNNIMLKKILATLLVGVTLAGGGAATFIYLNKKDAEKTPQETTKSVKSDKEKTETESTSTITENSTETTENASKDPKENLSLPAYSLTEKKSGIVKTYNAKGDIISNSAGGELRRSDGGYDRCLSEYIRDSEGDPLELYYIDGSGNRMLRGKYTYDDTKEHVTYEAYDENGETGSIAIKEYENGLLKKMTFTPLKSDRNSVTVYEYYEDGREKAAYETIHGVTRIAEQWSEDGKTKTEYTYHDVSLDDGSYDHTLIMRIHTDEFDDEDKLIKRTKITPKEYRDKIFPEDGGKSILDEYTVYEYDPDGYLKKKTDYLMDGTVNLVTEYELKIFEAG